MVNPQVTYGQVDHLLRRLGFVRQSVESQWQRYEHGPSDTVFILADKQPAEFARPSEVASVRIHLVAKGLISEEELEQQLADGPDGKKNPAANNQSA